MATIFERNGTQYLQFSVNGEQVKRSLGKISKTEAETIRLAKEYELRTGEDVLKRAQFYLFETLAHKYLDWHKFKIPDSHERIYQLTTQHLIPHFKGKAATITALDAEEYLNKRQRESYGKPGKKKPYATSSINKELRTLKAIQHKAVEWELIDKFKLTGVSELPELNSKPAHYYSLEKMDAIKADINGAIWRLMASTGLRRGEAIALRWDNVFIDKIGIISTSRDRTKSGEWRTVPLSTGAKEALDDLQNKNKEYQAMYKLKQQGEKMELPTGAGCRARYDSDYVLPRITTRSLSRWFDDVVKRLGFDGSLHSLRHTFCSHLVIGGTHLRVVQMLAGHANIKTTERYAYLQPEHLQASVEVLTI